MAPEAYSLQRNTQKNVFADVFGTYRALIVLMRAFNCAVGPGRLPGGSDPQGSL